MKTTRRKLSILLALSMIWAIGAALHARRNDKERAEHSAKWSYKICTDTKALRNDTDLSSCDAERAKTRAL